MQDINQKNKKERRFIFWALLSSFVFHGVLLFIHVKLNLPDKEITQNKTRKIKVVFKKKEAVNSKEKQQIVNTEIKGRKEKPQDSRFLGEKDQSYDRQTVAKKIDSFKEAGKGIKSGVSRPVEQVHATKSQGKVKDVAKKAKLAKKKTKKSLTLADLAVGEVKEIKPVKQRRPSMASLGLKNGKAGKSGLAQNNDFVEDIPLGDMTNLNTSEFKYFGFYDRIRKKLEQYWGNSLREKAEQIHRSGRRIPASENLVTSLIVSIDSKGQILEVVIKGTSGVTELDQAAVESFNKAGPFPNPPTGLIKNGRAQIEWGFVVKG